jgi:hypothetical protein
MNFSKRDSFKTNSDTETDTGTADTYSEFKLRIQTHKVSAEVGAVAI